jgi:hypothetical protein
MEVVTLSTKLVCPMPGQIKHSRQASLNRTGRVQNVISNAVPNGGAANMESRFSTFLSAQRPLLTAKAERYRYMTGSPRDPRMVVAFMNQNDKSWTGRENGVSADEQGGFLSRFGKVASCALAAGVLMFHTGLPAWAEEMRVTFPASKITEVSFLSLHCPVKLFTVDCYPPMAIRMSA